MVRRAEEESPASSSGASPSANIIDVIHSLAAKNARAKLDNEEQLLLYLQSWWSRTYNRPLKDPLLLSYSLEELLYEFFDRIERAKAEQERSYQEDVKIEEDKEREVLDWIEREEKRELEAMKAKESGSSNASSPNDDSPSTKDYYDPTKDPANVAWMEEQIRQAKEIYGESFGEDIIEETFE